MASKIGGIAAIAGTILSVFLMLKVWAILGGIVYLLTFGASLFMLKRNVAYEETFNIMTFLKRIKKETFWDEGVYAIVVALLPVIVCIFFYSWIILDSKRSADFIMKQIS